MQKLRDSIAVYDSLLRGLRDKLSENDRKTVNLGLASLQIPVSDSTCTQGTTMTPSLTEQGVVKTSEKSPSQRYLGEASDIRFFHDMELAYCRPPEPDRQQGHPEARVDSYEQEGPIAQDPGDKSHVLLPERASADRLVYIYFSTIHIAYPFISEPDFRQTYESFWQSDSLEGFRGPWLSLLCKFTEHQPSIFGRRPYMRELRAILLCPCRPTVSKTGSYLFFYHIFSKKNVHRGHILTPL